jgi:hypothetical protein
LSTKLNTETRGHHPDSPSSLQSSEACALFENEQRDSNASKIGTLQHKAAETREIEPLEIALAALGLSDADIAEKVEGVLKAINYEDEQMALFQDICMEYTIVREKYFPVGDDNVEGYIGVTGGFPDTVLVSEKVIVILDWKFGKNPVAPTMVNLQGIGYAVAAFQQYPTAQEVEIHFYHPHQEWSDEEHREKYVATMRREEVAEHELRIRTVVARKRLAAQQLKDSNFTNWESATPKHDLCIWCARKGNCGKLHSLVLKTASKHPDFIVPEVVNHLALSRPEQVKYAFLWASQLESIAKSIKKRAADMVLTEDLQLGDGIKLVKRTERYIASPIKLARIAHKHGLGLLGFIRSISISVSKIESQIKLSSEKGSGAANVRAFKTDLIESGVSKLGKPIYFLQEAKAPSEKQKQIIEIEVEKLE